jgi:hypothetical protein
MTNPNCIGRIAGFFVIVLLLVLNWFETANVRRAVEANSTSPSTEKTMPFNLSEAEIIGDLQGKWVTLPPNGQTWGFAADQKIEIKVMEIRDGTEKATVIVNLNATAPVPQEGPKEQINTPLNKVDKPTAKPISVTLNGIAKLHYELIAEHWYLTEVESVILGVKPN